ncbi:hypothetical protein NW769_015115 [Fusarium oxysporum]|nr:hypothetical protein NW769_015115 [Fusarium oxysporum]
MNGHSSQNGTSSQNVHSAQNGRQNGHSVNGHAPGEPAPMSKQEEELLNLTLQLRDKKDQDKKYARFHGDMLIGVGRTVDGLVTGTGLDGQSAATIGGNLSDYSVARNNLINSQVKDKYDKMLHPPLTYLGDVFQYRTADGKFNSAINPHLGQAGAPYAKTVPSKIAPLGALPDPADLFDKLMARQEGGRDSQSGLSAMLIYHATIIIHDIFRTNDNDKNISDSSSYLDLSPLYGYTNEMQRKIRDDKYKLGLLKPDTFAEDRLLRQPPGVCIMLVMYNRYHNYAARQLLRINENNRFRVPKMYEKTQLISLIYQVIAQYDQNGKKKLPPALEAKCKKYEKVWRKVRAERPADPPSALEQLPDETPEEKKDREDAEAKKKAAEDTITAFEAGDLYQGLVTLTKELEKVISNKADEISAKSEELGKEFKEQCEKFQEAWEAAWNKQDDDLFNTARLITCGMYIQISVHDYLRALMGFHQFDTNFTLDPRADFDQKKTSRGIGNQVTVEFNLLYRFHCAISMKDEATQKNTSLPAFLMAMKKLGEDGARDLKRDKVNEPWNVTFGIPDPNPVPTAGDGLGNSSDSGISLNRAATDASKATDAKDKPKSKNFTRNAITNLFDDQQMLDELTKAMDDPISNFGPRNVPKCLKAVEIIGILQARKWECGTLNDFRDFFSLP